MALERSCQKQEPHDDRREEKRAPAQEDLAGEKGQAQRHGMRATGGGGMRLRRALDQARGGRCGGSKRKFVCR